MRQLSARKAALKAAFPHTLPIMAGFLFLGFTYGLYMHSLGFGFLYPTLMALFIYGGSLEFVAASMLLSGFAPVQTLVIALIIQARHLFYGLAMLDKYKNMGRKKFYLIFGLCDETFSVNSSAEIPEGVDKGLFMFFVTLLNQLYWVVSAALGGLFGSVISLDLEGMDFVMTAMFTVIFLDQLLKEKQHYSSAIGVICTAVCLLIFGRDSFMIPSMLCILVLLTALRRPIEKGADEL